MLPLFIASTFAIPAASSSVQIPSDVLSVAVTAVRYASIAYCPASVTKALSCGNCQAPAVKTLKSIKVTTVDDLQYYTGYNPASNQIVVSYRGSSNAKNWQRNNDATLTSVSADAGTVKIHNGWLGSFKDTQSNLAADVGALLKTYPNADLLFAGHSSGAAVTAIAAFLAVQKSGFLTQLGVSSKRVNVITAAGPRVGNPAFATAFSKTAFKSAYRIAKGSDVVTLTPPEPTYKHFEREIYVDSSSTGDNIPVFCDQQPSSTKKGSCSNRYTSAEVQAATGGIGAQHMSYLGVRVGC
ncbi:Alpha/Beta hydrolase protein [Gorgonomyces haynaldii]|nr:Alpha/Beta hydrolase protein [Gorgonomyces haynaldii]